MTDDEQFDEPDFDDSDFDDPAHAGIRDLLASARVEEPLPAEVAARLDATLAELSGGAAATDDEPSKVVPLRRRSKVGPRLLAAAAVIVVAGAGAVGLNQVVQNTSGGDAKSPTASAAQDSGSKNSPELSSPEAPAAVPSPVDGLLGELRDHNLGAISAAAAKVPVLTTAKFAEQAADLKLTRLTVLTKSSLDAPTDTAGSVAKPPSPGSSFSGDETQSNQYDSSQRRAADRDRALALTARACTPPKLAGTTSYPIVLDGEPAVLVLHKPDGATRLVEAWSCDATQLLAIAAIPV